eukprot:TRINITY_DN8664_c0_g1_i1.p1 TRINITY_DN8664_c0_g1~~TRINITY_DN8664_c0_g1_i1.p1  ORF type:complete len:285 (+),score=52.85 TRINITY_DN8664_c0_g1_i1:3-857(+)
MEQEQDVPTSPFANMRISTHEHLPGMQRVECPKCQGSRKFFCYDCFIPMGDPALVPKLKLPIELDILHWPSELRSKSTAVHACVVAPDNTHFIDHPNLPDYDPEEVLLLFPSDDAPTVAEYPDLEKIKRVVFVDSQWHSAHRILREDKVKNLKHIKIKNHQTLFWRVQRCGEECLATIEAIYYFFAEYHERMHGTYNGEYDDLLFYFSYHYNLIQEQYRREDKVFPRKADYVQLIGGNEGKDSADPKKTGRKRRGKRENKKEPPTSKKQKVAVDKTEQKDQETK